MTILHVARFTFQEASRKKVLFGALLLSTLFLALFAIGNHFAYADFTRSSARPSSSLSSDMRPIIGGALSIAGLYVVNFLAGLLSIFSAVGTISSEIDSGTLHAIVPKPVRRWEIVLGKWLGYAVMLVIYLVAMGVALMAIVTIVWGITPPNPAGGLALMSLSTLMLLSLTILGGTLLPTVANGIVVFMLYGVGLMGGFIEQIGSLVRNDTMVNIGIVSSLLIPSDVLWKMASYVLQPEELLARSITTPIFGGSVPSVTMIGYTALYVVAAIVLSMVAFSRRDL
ncbi:MAG: ABC transporter permease subunit [Chloroflexota bacterium]